MADYLLVPAPSGRAPSPSQVRSKGRQLNTIIEESEDMMTMMMMASTTATTATTPRQTGHPQNRKQLKIEQWLSPLSDHFPTPRGFHFLSAPVLPSSPSAESADESVSPDSSSANNSAAWNRASIMTDATEFDDIYDVSDDDDCHDDNGRNDKMRDFMAANGGQRQDSRRALPPLVIPAGREVSSEAWSGRPDLKTKIMSPVAPTPTSGVAMSPAMVDFMQAQQALAVPTISAPPSLDGSLTSDQMAQMSAPPTPVIGGKDDDDEAWSGVHLQPGALATLQSLSTLSTPTSPVDFAEQVIELPLEPPRPREEMSERRRPPSLVFANMHAAADEASQAPAAEMSERQRQPLRLDTNPPAAPRGLAGLSKLEIPSPGGFFSGLSPRSRHTWHLPVKGSADEAEPPTSGMAERFYKTPWSMEAAPPVPSLPATRPLHMVSGDFSTLPVEQVVVVEGKGKEVEKEDPPTAIRIQPEPEPVGPVPSSSATLAESSSPVEEVTATEIVVNYDATVARKQQEIALSHLDRTEMWLLAQRAYLKGVVDSDDVLEEEEEALQVEAEAPPLPKEVPPTPPPKDKEQPQGKGKEAECAIVRKKTVRFSDVVLPARVPRSLPSKLLHQESAYYRAFTDYAVRSQSRDVFVSRQPRFEALQAMRVSLRDSHHNQLLGKYQLSVVPQSAKKRMSANVVRGDDVLTDDPAKLRADKEADALGQMAMATWHVAAWKLLSGNRLIAAPVHKRLARLSRMAPGPDGVCRDRARILDLGGQATCDWAWHAALAYPNTKIYTVTTKAIRQLSNSNIRGPPNHRQVAVERLTRLPFADSQFDLVRAADLHAILKYVGENGEDEWESCLQECLRVLKPGGFLEFTLLDSDIMNAGKLGNAKSVEFGFVLKRLGYDPSPTKLFLGRLQRAGFDVPHRAWMCLPVGPRPAALRGPPVARDPAGRPIPTLDLEAMVTGSADGIAAVSGLAAGWSWERWLLRAEMEKVAGELRLADIATAGDAMREARKTLDDVPAIVDEGRACGAGYRVLRGYTRKPRAGHQNTGLINMLLDTGIVA